MSKRKYKPAKRMLGIDDLLHSESNWFEVKRNCGKRMWHKSALIALQVRTLATFISCGVYECVSSDEVSE